MRILIIVLLVPLVSLVGIEILEKHTTAAASYALLSLLLLAQALMSKPAWVMWKRSNIFSFTPNAKGWDVFFVITSLQH